MTMSAQHRAWLASGGQYSVCTPGRMLRDVLRAAGFTVYDIGNTDHLDHQPPEDHTPYSETGWPGTSPYGVVMAIDIMPDGPISLQQLGAILHADKASGKYPPIKYMNWGPSDDAHAVQCRWKPDHVQGSSSDTGHIHISFRTDYAGYSVPYNPLEDEVEQNDQVTGYKSKGNRVGDVLADTSNERDWWYAAPGGNGSSLNPPPAGSRADVVVKAAQLVPGIVDKINTIQAGQVDQAAVNAAVAAALTDPAVIAALVKAVNDDAARRAAE